MRELRRGAARCACTRRKTFELPLEHDVIVTGRMDQVNRIEAESAKWRSSITKPEGRRTRKERTKDLQLSVYALAAEEVLELKPVRLVFYNLTTNEAVATTRDAKALAKTKQKIAEVADQIRAREFSARSRDSSASICDYKPLCPAHEQLISIRPATRSSDKLNKRRKDRATIKTERRLSCRSVRFSLRIAACSKLVPRMNYVELSPRVRCASRFRIALIPPRPSIRALQNEVKRKNFSIARAEHFYEECERRIARGKYRRRFFSWAR